LFLTVKEDLLKKDKRPVNKKLGKKHKRKPHSKSFVQINGKININ
jgi:hypothetical protein